MHQTWHHRLWLWLVKGARLQWPVVWRFQGYQSVLLDTIAGAGTDRVVMLLNAVFGKRLQFLC